MDRRPFRGPPPPYGGFDDRGPPPPRGPYDREMERGRRPRSPSPPYERYGRGRSPPDFKRPRRDEFEPPFRRGSPEYRRGSPPPRFDERDREYERRDMRGGSVPRDREEANYLMAFKEFMLKRVPDDCAPEEAQRMYQEYRVDFFGSAIKADFEQHKDQEYIRAQFDPRSSERLLAKKAEEAKDTASQLTADILSGKVDPKQENFNQGMYEQAPKAEAKPVNPEDAPRYAPALCWTPQRVQVDLSLSKRLIHQLDAEKGILTNPVVPTPAGGAAAAAAAAAVAAAEAKEGDGAADGQPNQGDGQEGEKKEEGAAPMGIEPAAAEADVIVDETNLAASISQLDMQLTWLWRVHGIDYYSGHELVEGEWPYRLTACRLIRGPCPEPGENEGPEAAAVMKQEAEEIERIVDESWKRRLTEGDPVEARCFRKRVDGEVEKWINSQVTMIADNKWGSKLSNKMFVGRKYVVKHIRSKHEDKLLVEREKAYDEIYFESFRAFREEEEKRRQEEEAAAAAAAAAAEAEHAGGNGHEGPSGGEGMAAPGRGMRGRGMRGRMGMMGRGRGHMGMGMGMGRGMMGMDGPMIVPVPAMAPMMAPMMMPGPMMAPMMMPGPMMAPMGMGGGRMGMGMGGGRGMRGGMRGGRGGGMGRGGNAFKEYFDLDAPANNRSLLDYGDL